MDIVKKNVADHLGKHYTTISIIISKTLKLKTILIVECPTVMLGKR